MAVTVPNVNRLFCTLQSSPGMLESCALVINCRIWELMSSTLEEKTHRTDDRDRDINTAWGWIARPVEVPGGLFHDGCGLVAISSNREAYEARGMAACGINFNPLIISRK